MYFLYRFHHWDPREYLNMGYGARRVIAAFVYREIEDRNKEYEKVSGHGQ